MKHRAKEISIFNLSMLDVIFGAMGAFLLLFLMVMMEVRPPAKPCTPCKKCLTCPRCVQCRPCAPCKRSAFFVIWITWTKRPRSDIDLYAIAPNGKYCGFAKKHESGPPEMDLLWDYRIGGHGNKETILVPQATPGRWRISYHHYKGASAIVRGFLRGSAGISYRIPPIRVSRTFFGFRSRTRGWGGRVVLEFSVTNEGSLTGFRHYR